jgi:NADPH-dependent F420 reductase
MTSGVPRGPIAVLGGTGHQGRGLAIRLALAGFPVIVGSRDPGRAEAAIKTWPPLPGSVRPTDYGTAIAEAEVVVLAVPFESAGALLDEHRARFKEQALVIDVMVPMTVASGALMLSMVPEGSAAQHVRTRLPPHVRLAATFKTIPAELLNDTDRSLDCDEFVCGDSVESRSQATALVEAIRGLRAIDVGPLTRARSLEHLTLLAVAINRRNKIHDARFRVVGL